MELENANKERKRQFRSNMCFQYLVVSLVAYLYFSIPPLKTLKIKIATLINLLQLDLKS